MRSKAALFCACAAAAGLLAGATHADTITYQYDVLGRVVVVVNPDGTQISYSYDLAGNRIQTVVSSTNQPPNAVNDSRTAQKNTALTFDPRTNDTDPNGHALTITAKTNGTNGTVVITGGGTGVTYTPTTGYTGADSFTYTISDGNGGTDTATVSMVVNAPPVAVVDTKTTPVSTPLTFDPRTNDSDADGGTLTVTAKTNGSNGTVTFTATSLTYTPTTGYAGSDSFTYTISDGQGGTTVGTVNVTVTSTNQPPDAVNDSRTAQKNTALAFDPRTNDTDPNGHALTITAKTNGTNGTVVITGGGTGVTYTPTTGYTGADSFTYTISDGNGGTDTATVSMVVNAPPVAVVDTKTTPASTALTFDPRTNDSDADGGTLSITAKTNGTNGTVVINAGASVTYTPTTGYVGSDSFTYTISDGQGGVATGTVNFTVTGGVADGTVLYTKSTSGSFSFTIPAGVTQVDIEGWGGGNNGRGTLLWEEWYMFGGSGGGYFKKRITVTQGQVISGTVSTAGPASSTTVSAFSLVANSPSSAVSGTGGTATGGDVNTQGIGCCYGNSWTGGGAGNGGGDALNPGDNGTAPGGGGAGDTGTGKPGQIRITARTN